jgi:hypothetical protein
VQPSDPPIQPIQLTRKGVAFTGTTADLRRLRAQFRRDHYIILPKLIGPQLMEIIQRCVEAALFRRQEYNGVVAQSLMGDPGTLDFLLFLVNMPEFHRLIQQITGCRRIASFRGRVYRLLPSTNDRIIWHSDIDIMDQRLIAFSMNLTPTAYSSGSLQIKYRGSDKILHEVHNTGFDDALFLRVAHKLHHCVLSVRGDVPRTAMAGWFRWDHEDFHSQVRNASSAQLLSPPANLDPEGPISQV